LLLDNGRSARPRHRPVSDRPRARAAGRRPPPHGAAAVRPPRRHRPPRLPEPTSASATYFSPRSRRSRSGELTGSIRPPAPGHHRTRWPGLLRRVANALTVPCGETRRSWPAAGQRRRPSRSAENAATQRAGAAPAGRPVTDHHQAHPAAVVAASSSTGLFGSAGHMPTMTSPGGKHPPDRLAALLRVTIRHPPGQPSIATAVRGQSAASQSMGQGRARLCSCRSTPDAGRRRASRAGTTAPSSVPKARRDPQRTPEQGRAWPGGRHRRWVRSPGERTSRQTAPGQGGPRSTDRAAARAAGQPPPGSGDDSG